MQRHDRGARRIGIASLSALTIFLVSANANAQTVEEFYKGRTVTLIVGSGADLSGDPLV